MELRSLSPLLQVKAQKEINEDPNRIAGDLSSIRDWLKKQSHLKAVNPSDQWLVSFLRGNKYSLEKTKHKIDMYYTLRTLVPEIFRNRNPFDPNIQGILKLGSYLPLVNLEADDSNRIVVIRLEGFENSKYSMVDLLKVMLMIIDILILEDDNYIIAGLKLLIDLRGVGLYTFSQWTPAVSKKIVTIMENALPNRMAAGYLFHTPKGFDTAYSIFRMFLSDKFKKRFNVYGQNIEAMYEVVPRILLPAEYGGESGTVQELIDYWKNKVESYKDWFLSEELAGSDETLRPGPPKSSSDLFGVEGSFRKLDLD